MSYELDVTDRRGSASQTGMDIEQQKAKRRRTIKPPIDDAELARSAPDRPPKTLPWYALLFFNLVSIVGLAFLLKRLAISLFPCVSAMAAAIGTALCLVLICHLFWRYFHVDIRSAKGTLRLVIARLRLDRWLFVIADRLHPWWLSVPALWSVTLLVLLTSLFLFLNSLSPLMRAEMPPYIEIFRVQGASGREVAVRPGGFAEVRSGDSVRIEAEVLDCGSCQWSASLGEIHDAGCVAQYQAPFYGSRDTLWVLLKSPCQTQDGLAGLNVEVTQNPF